MEHRCGNRRPSGLTILLRRRGWGGWKVGRLRDLSITGAFVEVDPGAFGRYGTVQIEVTRPGGTVSGLMRCQAMVMRLTEEGLGLAFDEVRPAALEPLFRHPGAGGSGAGGTESTRQRTAEGSGNVILPPRAGEAFSSR